MSMAHIAAEKSNRVDDSRRNVSNNRNRKNVYIHFSHINSDGHFSGLATHQTENEN